MQEKELKKFIENHIERVVEEIIGPKIKELELDYILSDNMREQYEAKVASQEKYLKLFKRDLNKKVTSLANKVSLELKQFQEISFKLQSEFDLLKSANAELHKKIKESTDKALTKAFKQIEDKTDSIENHIIELKEIDSSSKVLEFRNKILEQSNVMMRRVDGYVERNSLFVNASISKAIF